MRPSIFAATQTTAKLARIRKQTRHSRRGRTRLGFPFHPVAVVPVAAAPGSMPATRDTGGQTAICGYATVRKNPSAGTHREPSRNWLRPKWSIRWYRRNQPSWSCHASWAPATGLLFAGCMLLSTLIVSAASTSPERRTTGAYRGRCHSVVCGRIGDDRRVVCLICRVRRPPTCAAQQAVGTAHEVESRRQGPAAGLILAVFVLPGLIWSACKTTIDLQHGTDHLLHDVSFVRNRAGGKVSVWNVWAKRWQNAATSSPPARELKVHFRGELIP